MLTKGITLSLLIGPIIPFPVPRLILDALDSVEVTSAAGKASGFQLSFQFSNKSALNTFFLIAGAQSTAPGMPALRVMLVRAPLAIPRARAEAARASRNS